MWQAKLVTRGAEEDNEPKHPQQYSKYKLEQGLEFRSECIL